MFRASYQLPVIFGSEIYPTNMHAPTTVRAYVDPTEITTPGADPDAAARRIVDAYAGTISQFVQATRQAAYAGGNLVYNRVLPLERCYCIFQINNGQETLTLYVRPAISGGSTPSTLFVDIRTIFYHWPIPGAQTHSPNPANWEFNAQDGKGNKQGTFYSFYNPPFAPSDRKNTRPVMSVGGAQPTTIYEDFHWEPTGALDPKTAGGYVEDLWLRESENQGNGIGGTGFYDVLLSGKQYWEAEIRTLPTLVPPQREHTLDGTDDGSSYEDPTILKTPVLYRMKYPAELNTFLNPIIGVIPKHWIEEFKAPDKSKDYSQTELDGLPQVPPRDNIRFTHTIIGLDPDPSKPRSIGAVRTSVIRGDEVTKTKTQPLSSYSVTIPEPFWPAIFESHSQTEITAQSFYGGPFFHYTYNYILAGWWAALFSTDALTFDLCGANPYWDVPDAQKPSPRGVSGMVEGQFIAAGGYVYQIINLDPSTGGARESGPAPIPAHGPWAVPMGGPPPGFVEPGAPARQYPGPGGPYFRCVGIVGDGGTGPWFGPAYVYTVSGPKFEDPDSSRPTQGPVTEVRGGSAIPNTILHGIGGGAATVRTDTFPNQLFGDFLMQPKSSSGDGDGGTRLPRKVMVPLNKGEGRYMPLIKGRGDLMKDHYRDVVSVDNNYDKTSVNYGYDTGVDLGDPKVGDRLMWASDTKTGRLWVGINGVWKGPDGGPADPAKDIGWACLMDREMDDTTGQLKDAAYYAAASYRYGSTWIRLWLGQGLKYKAPAGFGLLGRTTKSTP